MTTCKIIKKALSFVLCFVVLVMQMSVCSAARLSSVTLEEDFEGESIRFPASLNTTDRILVDGEEAEDENNAGKYLNLVTNSGYYDLGTRLQGNIVFDFRAKNNSTTRPTLVTRDGGSGETWKRVANLTFSASEWTYFRVVINYPQQSLKLYSSVNGFMDLAEVSVPSTDISFIADSSSDYAAGVKTFRFANVMLDDMKIYKLTQNDIYYSDLEDNSVDVSRNFKTSVFFVNEIDKTLVTRENVYVKNAETGDKHYLELEPYSFGFTAESEEPLDFGTYYYLCTENLTFKADSEAAVNVQIPFTTELRVYDVFLTGKGEVGKTLTADIGSYAENSDLRIEWLRSDSKDGEYVVIDGETELTYEAVTIDEECYIMFKLYSGSTYLTECEPIKIVTPVSPTDISFIVNEDFEGEDFLWKSSTSENRVFGDNVNPTNYRAAVSGYTTLNSEVNGKVIIEFMAKGTSSWISFTTRQNSNYQKTIATSLQPSFVNSWGYYRIVLDCENQTGKVYSSASSFTEMVESDEVIAYKDATGFNQISIANCYLDNLRILQQPASGSFYTNIKDGQEDANIENGIEFLFYEPMNIATETETNIQLINTTDDLEEKTIENAGMFGFRVVPSYADIYNRNFECTLSENIKNSENNSIKKTILNFSTTMKKLTDSITVEGYSLVKDTAEYTTFDALSGNIGARLILTNNGDTTNTFVVAMALYKNVGNKEIFEDYIITNVTLDAEAEKVQVDTTSTLVVPEHTAGSYSIKMFIWDSIEGKKPLAEQIDFNAVTESLTEEISEAGEGLELDTSVDSQNGEFTIKGIIGTDKESRIGYTVKNPEGEIIYLGQTLNKYNKAQFGNTVILNTGALSGTYTLSAKDTAGLTDVHNFTVSTENIKPRALNVYISGSPVMGSVVNACHTLFHPNISGQDVSEYRWYKASEKDGQYILIEDAVENSYTLAEDDAAKYVKCAVIPKIADYTLIGDEVRSDAVKVIARPVATNLSIKGTVKEGQRVTADYAYYDADGKGETSTVVKWYIDGDYVSTGATYTIPSGKAGKKLSFSVEPGADGSNGDGDIVTSDEVTISSAGSGGGGGTGGSGSASGNKVSIGGIEVQPTVVETVKPKFADIENHWAKEIIETLNKQGIIKGKSENEFAPDASITRAEYAALIVRIANLSSESSVEVFNDVESGSWYFDVVNTAKQHGLIDGFEGAFRPNDSITRQEATAIIYRLCKLIGKDAEGDKTAVQFADSMDIAEWALEGIEFSAQAGIILGDENNNFRPNANLSRAEAAAILSRI